jgi:hypothetical protein
MDDTGTNKFIISYSATFRKSFRGNGFDFAILISTTHFHVRENLKKTPAWPSFTGYVGVLPFW